MAEPYSRYCESRSLFRGEISLASNRDWKDSGPLQPRLALACSAFMFRTAENPWRHEHSNLTADGKIVGVVEAIAACMSQNPNFEYYVFQERLEGTG